MSKKMSLIFHSRQTFNIQKTNKNGTRIKKISENWGDMDEKWKDIVLI